MVPGKGIAATSGNGDEVWIGNRRVIDQATAAVPASMDMEEVPGASDLFVVVNGDVRGRFLVSDAMAVTGSDLDQFTLGGRRIRRAGGRLTLDDGTLAGADLHLGRAVQVLIEQVGTRPEVALAMASSVPANAAGMADGLGRITPGTPARLIRIAPDFSHAEPVRV